MGYSKKIYETAIGEIKSRKTKAEFTAQQHRFELNARYPEFAFIDAELAKTGREIIGAFYLPKEQAEKKFAEVRKRNGELREERRNLLIALKLPEDYLDVKYTCTKCSDTGFIEERDASTGISYGTRLCECHTDLLKKLAFEKMAKSTPLELCSFEDFDLSLYSKVKKEGVSPYEAMSGVYKSCIRYAESFDLDSNNLYFYGRTGLGKTHLSLAIANEVIKKGYSVVYGSLINFLNKIKDEQFDRDDGSVDTENMLIEADLLILDDMGTENPTAFKNAVLYNIINSRLCRGVPTIISSNLSLAEIRDTYPESLASRIIGTYEKVNFKGDDIRQIING